MYMLEDHFLARSLLGGLRFKVVLLPNGTFELVNGFRRLCAILLCPRLSRVQSMLSLFMQAKLLLQEDSVNSFNQIFLSVPFDFFMQASCAVPLWAILPQLPWMDHFQP
jgi:hypothetical protein